MSEGPKPALISSAFSPSALTSDDVRMFCGRRRADIACNVLSDILTIDGYSITQDDVTLSLPVIHTRHYDTLTLFAVANAPLAASAQIVGKLTDHEQSRSRLMFVEAHAATITSGTIAVRPSSAIALDLSINRNTACGGLQLRVGLYRSSEMAELADRYGSDKGMRTAYSLTFCAHGYAEVYDRVFSAHRNRAMSILEIGLHTPSTYEGIPSDAPSLRMWSEYFPKAAIFGFDRNDFSGVRVPRGTILRGDQSDREDLIRAARKAGWSFGIIVDDGSHQSSHQQISLGALFPYLAPGGLYVIEDLSWQPDPLEQPRTADLLRQWAKDGTLRTDFITDEEKKFLAANVASIEFAKPFNSEMVVLTRK